MDTINLPRTNTQFASLMDNMVREILGESLLLGKNESAEDPLAILWTNELHFNLRVRPGALGDVETLERRIMDRLEPIGITSETRGLGISQYLLTRKGKVMGRFNTDIYLGRLADTLMITFAGLSFR